MSFKATFWTCAAGGTAWGGYEDGLLITPIFTSQDSFDIFEKKIKEIDRSQLIVTVVEHHDNYSLVFYEDPREEMIPDFGFVLSEMNLEGYYSKFKKDFKTNFKIFFSYAKQLQEPMPMQSTEVKIEPLIEPFLIKNFRIISESDLELDEFKKQISVEGYSPKDFKYHNEAIGIMTVVASRR